MKEGKDPLVSVVTPVYNGERYLSEAIESVRRQTYGNWKCTILNNRSTDGTRAIAERHAREDPRIHVMDSPRFLPLIDNWNHALSLVDENSTYIKVLHADDLLMPECLQRMVEAGERHPEAGIIGSYILRGTHVTADGLPLTQTLIEGHDVVRETFRKHYYLYGSPSSLMLRTSLVLGSQPFYDARFFHADVEACHRTLQTVDFAFVHQVLTHTRLHEESQTERIGARLSTNVLENLVMLMQHGPRVFEPDEFARLYRRAAARYYGVLARHLLKSGDVAVLKHHRERLRHFGVSFHPHRLVWSAIARCAGAACRPQQLVGRVWRNAR